jgi:Ca2+-dependent lipid-binding protein
MSKFENKYKSVLKVEVRSAKDLRDADLVGGKSDPYAVVSFSNDHAYPRKLKTHFLNNCTNPVWNSTMYFLVHDECKSFKVEVFDKDLLSDSSLGYVNLLRKDEDDRSKLAGDWFYLEKGKGGTIEIFTQEIALKEGLGEALAQRRGCLEDFLRSKEREDLALLEVRVHGAKGLKSGFIDKSDPYVRFDFSKDPCGDKVEPKKLRSRTIDNNPNPVWEEVFHFLVPYELRSFKIEVMDEDTVSDDSLGHSNVVIARMGEQRVHSRLAVSKKGELDVSYFLAPLKVLFS